MPFRDFIPEGEDPGPIGKGGYRDFIPESETKTDPKVAAEYNAPSVRWTKKRLTVYAKNLGVKVGSKAAKKVIVAAIKKAQTPEETQEPKEEETTQSEPAKKKKKKKSK